MLAVVRRDTDKGKRINQWTPTDGGWIAKGVGGARKLPLYRLPSILAAPPDQGIVVVEGEKCVHACVGLWPEQPVTTWAGGVKVWKRTDWEPLAGRTVTLVADGDDPGHACMGEIAARLAGLGCKVWLVLPPTDKTDIADWIEADPTGRNAGEMIRRHRHRWLDRATDIADAEAAQAEDQVVAAAESIVADAASEPLRNNKHYRLLGLHGDLVVVRIAAGRLLYRSRESMMSPSTLLAIAADEKFWQGLNDGAPLTVASCRVLGSAIVRAADRLGPVDLSHITGRGAVRTPDGKVVYHLGDRLWADGSETTLEQGGLVYLAEPRLDLGTAATDDEMRAIGEAVMDYRWETPVDGRRLMGWIVASIIGGALEWRPHILMNAPPNTGKSWLLREVVHKLMGPMLQRLADATPAALARLTAQSSLPVAWDEFEPGDAGVDELLKQLRISSGAEGMRIRADNTSGGIQVQEPRYCALLSGAAPPMLNRANASRLALVRLGSEVADWPAVRRAIREAMVAAVGARSRIVAQAAELADAVRDLSDAFQDDGLDSREAMSSAALTIGWQAWCVDNATVFAGTSMSNRTDAGDCLLDILAVRVRGDGRERPVLSLVRSRDDRLEYAAANLFGVRRTDDGTLLVSPHHAGLKSALARTEWSGTDLARLLRQLPGTSVTNHPRHFGDLRSRAIEVSSDTLTVLGVDLSPPPHPQEPAGYDDEPPPPEEMPDNEMNF